MHHDFVCDNPEMEADSPEMEADSPKMKVPATVLHRYEQNLPNVH